MGTPPLIQRQVHLATGRLGAGPLTWTEFYEEPDALVAEGTRADPVGLLQIRIRALRDGSWTLVVHRPPLGFFASGERRLLVRGQATPGINPWVGDAGLGAAWMEATDAGLEQFGPAVWRDPDAPLQTHPAREAERAAWHVQKEQKEQARAAARRAEEQRVRQRRQRALRVRPEVYLRAALRTWPVTNYAPYAGFILPNGQMLDFSGGSGERVHDHREITSVHDALPSGTEGMMIFMRRTGSIRVGYSPGRGRQDPAFVWLHLAAPPTDAQIAVVGRMLRDFPVDAVEVLGAEGAHQELRDWPSAAAVAGGMRRIGAGG